MSRLLKKGLTAGIIVLIVMFAVSSVVMAAGKDEALYQ